MDKNNLVNSGIESILRSAQNIAIVGLSVSMDKDSFHIAEYLQNAGYNIFPVNPKYDSILNNKCYPDLESIPELIDIVDIFRRADQVLSVVESTININAKVVWMQLGIINQEASVLALKAGLQVIMDRCIKIEHRHYLANY